MKKFYKIITLLLLFAFLSTYSPLNETNLNLENNHAMLAVYLFNSDVYYK